jgi:hypothetical protein
MKIYKFFYTGSKKNIMRTHRERTYEDMYKDYELYAITTNKELAKKFMDFKGKKSFVMTTSHMSKEEYVDFIQDYGREDLVINEEIIYTRSDDNLTKAIPINIPMTQSEYNFVSDFDTGILFDDPSLWEDAPPTKVLKKDIRKALEKIAYPIHRHLYGGAEDEKLEDDYSAPDFELDWLMILCKYFPGTFSD